MKHSGTHDWVNVDKYRGLWIALDQKERIVASDKKARTTYDLASNRGIKVPILFKVPLKPTLVM